MSPISIFTRVICLLLLCITTTVQAAIFLDKTSYLRSDEKATLIVQLDTPSAINVKWYKPGNILYGEQFATFTSNTQFSLFIKDRPPAIQLGEWSVEVYANGILEKKLLIPIESDTGSRYDYSTAISSDVNRLPPYGLINETTEFFTSYALLNSAQPLITASTLFKYYYQVPYIKVKFRWYYQIGYIWSYGVFVPNWYFIAESESWSNDVGYDLTKVWTGGISQVPIEALVTAKLVGDWRADIFVGEGTNDFVFGNTLNFNLKDDVAPDQPIVTTNPVVRDPDETKVSFNITTKDDIVKD